jgi:hypothetical protein
MQGLGDLILFMFCCYEIFSIKENVYIINDSFGGLPNIHTLLTSSKPEKPERTTLNPSVAELHIWPSAKDPD